MPTDLPPATAELADALLSLRDRGEMLRFLRDLCTLQELEALAHRWQIVNLLEEHVPYVEIAERVGASTTTVTRVAQWLRHGAGGYRTALDRLRRKRK
ncbi:MAG TPA: YerC/YecD family TrpR-related protein [Gaiellaceae bacterium]